MNDAVLVFTMRVSDSPMRAGACGPLACLRLWRPASRLKL